LRAFLRVWRVQAGRRVRAAVCVRVFFVLVLRAFRVQFLEWLRLPRPREQRSRETTGLGFEKFGIFAWPCVLAMDQHLRRAGRLYRLQVRGRLPARACGPAPDGAGRSGRGGLAAATRSALAAGRSGRAGLAGLGARGGLAAAVRAGAA
jgi:hypothetical protein